MPRLFLFIPCLAILAGCGGADYESAEPTFNDIASDINQPNNFAGATLASKVGGDALVAPLQRKIVYTADVEVVVEDYTQAAEQAEE